MQEGLKNLEDEDWEDMGDDEDFLEEKSEIELVLPSNIELS